MGGIRAWEFATVCLSPGEPGSWQRHLPSQPNAGFWGAGWGGLES